MNDARPRRRPTPIALRSFALAAALVLAAATAWWWLRAAPATTSRPPAQAGQPAPAPAYVDNQQCLGCHPDQARLWQASHHALAMALPTPQTVRGNFSGTEFKHQGVTSRFFKRGDKFLVRTDGPDGKLADFEIAYTFGLEPLQQYLIALPGGRLQPLQIAWDDRRKRWFHLLPHEKAPAGDVLHWSGRYQTANTMCIACHTTGFEKRYDAATDTFDSRWAEINVSCQSCHGAGPRHVAWAQAKAQGRPIPAALAGERMGLGVDFKGAPASTTVEVCAPCHSRRSELQATPVPGAQRLDNYLPATLSAGLYHADGQQLDEVYVDGSFRQSKMYQAGVGCSDCHDPHSGKLKLHGNAVCLACHQAQAKTRFPTAAGDFDTPAHHFHAPGSAGAQCVACHMPPRTYMQIQARPDHSLRVPRPDLSVKIGTPNACNGCHKDKPAAWAAAQVRQWYGPERTRRREQPHYGETFAAARAAAPQAGAALARIVGDTQRPGIVRATALSALRHEPEAGVAERIEASRDASPEVRAAAASSLEALPASRRVPALAPLLRDPVLAVRIAAARSLAPLPAEQFDPAVRPAFDAALAEYMAAQRVNLDMPGAHLNLAVVNQLTGQDALAEQHYLRALTLDPDFTPARANLAQFYSARSRNADAERVLVEGLRRVPGLGELRYSLGLLLAEEQRMPEAATALAEAARLLPGRARVHYNLGLVLQALGRLPQAEAALLAGLRADPADPELKQALVALRRQQAQAGR